MAAFQPPTLFCPQPADVARIVTWVHLGDLHMTGRGKQNHSDLHALVDRINQTFAGAISFVFLPGDVADQGSPEQYAIVREALDRLQAPWCAIVGDHDVHTKSFEPFRNAMSAALHFSFQIGRYRFVALNAFERPDPASFAMLPGQLIWLETQLATADTAILLLHCYPSDLKQGGPELQALVEAHSVRLIDMGHTHYNEVANDGHTLYTTTRSTGQIEEGEVGFSVTNLDGEVLSWRFFHLAELTGNQPAIMITSPSDERFITDPTLDGAILSGSIHIRCKVWSSNRVATMTATLANRTLPLTNISGSQVWECVFERDGLPDGVYRLTVVAGSAEDTIRIVLGRSAYHPSSRSPRDQDNALEAWPERGLLATQLGPNKNGRKW